MTTLAPPPASLFPEWEPPFRRRVYFGLGHNGQVKIGLTARRSGRRGGEMHFDELCAVPGDRLIEQTYHDRYAAERIGRTEWFRLSDRLLMDMYVMCIKQELDMAIERLRRIIEQRLQQAA